MRHWFVSLAASLVVTASAAAQQVAVEEFTLDNGMKFLLVPRTDQPNIVAAGWLAKVGSVNERPGITGLSHFFEHMMFKGTTTIGTRDPKQDADFMARQKAVKDKISALTWGQQYERFRAGEIDDPWDAKNDTDELRTLRGELKALMDEHRSVIVKDEFDSIYSKLGGSGMNAFTSYDVTFYFINVPSNKVELWAWMESDRLSDSVFREFYAERDVVHEERRLRTESTPTGPFEEQFEAMFWQSSPYAFPVIGWPSDLNSYSKEDARAYWDIYYRPSNLVGVMVGDFDPAAVKPLIKRYFSRLSGGGEPAPPVRSLEIPRTAEMRMFAECDCQPQIQAQYLTVPIGHADSYPLEVLGSILSGRTGRLYKGLVEGREIASSAGARQESRKYAGSFGLQIEVKGNATPDQLLAAWDEEVERLRTELVGERELQKVKNQLAVNNYRRLQSNFFLLVQLGMAEATVGWQELNDAPPKLQAVTAQDLQRVAKKYLNPVNRCVGIYTRKAGSEEDPALMALEPRARDMAKAILARLDLPNRSAEELAALHQDLEMRLPQVEQAQPQMAAGMKFIIEKVKTRIAEMQGQSPAKE